MDKRIIVDAYYRGLITKEECTKLLGFDPTLLEHENEGYRTSNA